jgi:hypothetical protein
MRAFIVIAWSKVLIKPSNKIIVVALLILLPLPRPIILQAIKVTSVFLPISNSRHSCPQHFCVPRLCQQRRHYDL